jgi:membrane fusion protein, multidrug efflux system
VRAKARFENKDSALFPNQFVNVQLQLDTVKQALVVPAAAVRHGPQGTFVYVVAQDNTAKVRQVKTGPAIDDRTSITSGLQPGERVVTEGGDRLTDGSLVRLPGQRQAEGAAAAGGQRVRSGQRGNRQAQPGSGANGAPGAQGGNASGQQRRHRPPQAATDQG